MQAIQAGGKELGYSGAVANIFPRKESELIEVSIYGDLSFLFTPVVIDITSLNSAAFSFPFQYFLEECREKMNSELEERREEIGEMRIRDKIATAVRVRLKLVAPYINVWPRAIYVMSKPPNAPSGLYNLHKLVDDMWYAAGDKSTDLNW